MNHETIQDTQAYDDPAACRATVFDGLTRYNTRRWHTANGHLNSDDYERRHHTAQLTLAA